MRNDGPTPVNLADLLAVAAGRYPAEVALVTPGASRSELTWAELDAAVGALAAGLGATGLIAGARLGLLGPNSTAFVVAYLAALRGGVVVVPLNPQSTPSELEVLLTDSGARVLMAAPDLTPVGLPGVRTLPLTDAGLAALGVADAPVSSPRDAESLAVLLYTAGTSGRPKAAMLSHRALLAHVEHLHALGLLGPESTVLANLPLFHVFGLNAVLGSWLRSGGRLVVVDGSGPAGGDLSPLLREERVTNLPLAPPTLHRLLGEDGLEEAVATVQTVVSGAAPLPEDLAAEFTARTGIEVAQGYGLTEAAPGVTATLGGVRRGHGHVGRALPGVEIRIGDGSDASEPAEVSIRGDNLFSGYWPDGAGGPDAEGWFPTGDIGYLDDGELFLVDRARELVIVNGFNVYPAEVEQVIGELPEIASVAVVGRPDRRTGEQVVAFVVAEEPTPAATLAELVSLHCEQRLARFKRPTALEVVPELPRGATGKVRKGLLRERAGLVAGLR
ncbi:class I adenylate-forming enzyme family protein [uncultured Friedmanniella sp.]|uniref:class I adenylate-forming enzyme family protein n=1 Tax=uncultured Friedmanniella sp. TaxID=335381 RepID=UPI0035CA8918